MTLWATSYYTYTKMAYVNERRMTITNNVSCYVEARIKKENDRIQAMNIIKTINAAIIQGNAVLIEFELIYDALQPTYTIDFYTNDREITLASLTNVLDNRQVLDVCMHPENVYGPGYVRVQTEKINKEEKSKKRKLERCLDWKLTSVRIDSVPEMGVWATDVDKQITKEILQLTYGMYPEMPIIRVSIVHKNKEKYTILCENVPAINYGYLRAMENKFPTYIQQISECKETKSSVCY